MGTDPDDGTGDSSILAGKNNYAAGKGLDIDSNIQYIPDTPNLADRVKDILDAGGDVEALIAWSGGGGHAAMVTGIVCYGNGQFQISYVDDPEQGDGKAENEEKFLFANPDGTFNRLNPNGTVTRGRIDGFLLESAGGAKVGAARFSPTSPATTDTASDLLTRFLRSSPFGQFVGAASFPGSVRHSVGVSPWFFLAPSHLAERDVSRPVARSPRKFIN